MTEIKRTFANIPLADPLTQEQKDIKIKNIAELYSKILEELEIDWENDPNSKDTPKRVAKAFVNDWFSGRFDALPSMTEFENTSGYQGLITVGPISFDSKCSHHHAIFSGYCFIHIVPDADGKLLGLSKYARIVQKISSLPQIQEEMTQQIFNTIEELLKPKALYVSCSARHTCMSSRGAKDKSSVTTTASMNDFMRNSSDLRREVADNERKNLQKI